MNFRVMNCNNDISKQTQAEIGCRYRRIIKAVNREFWFIDSDTQHGLYVGSYGRGTAVDSSDIDMLVEIPLEQHDRFNAYAWNGQSKLLQIVKDAILTTYPSSSVKADGQVVKVDFVEGMRFEVLPAFAFMSGGKVTYKFPDTNMGGHWDVTNPLSEQEAISQKDETSNGLLRVTCRHIRKMRSECYSSYLLSGILIDSFVYSAIGNWCFPKKTQQASSSSITYEQALFNYYRGITYNDCCLKLLDAPGSHMPVNTSDGWVVLGKILNRMIGG